MKTLRLLILFTLVVLGAYVEDNANSRLRDAKHDVPGYHKAHASQPKNADLKELK